MIVAGSRTVGHVRSVRRIDGATQEQRQLSMTHLRSKKNRTLGIAALLLPF
jgi:hypothetical protein